MTPPESELISGQGGILVVDDEDLVRNVAARMLSHLGYRVVTAADGTEAVEYYRAYRQEIALVVIDMVMPSMSGRECFRALKEIDPQVKAILSTGYDHNLAVQEILDEGMHGFVQKPYELSQLSQVVAQALRSPSREGPAPPTA
jgi:CheY-like chemotaxis protein